MKMQKKSWFNFLLTGFMALMGSVVGLLIGGLLYGTLLPLWTVTSLGQARDEVIDILFIKYEYLEARYLEDNTLYLQTQSGNVYSVNRNQWQLLPSLPNGQIISKMWLREWKAEAPIVAVTIQDNAYQMIDGHWEAIEHTPEQFKGFVPASCATEWYLPVAGVTDSAGTVFGHALASEYICYVLLQDGQLQGWTRTRDAFSLIGILIVSALIGLIAGFNTLPVWNYFKHMRAKEKHS